MDSNALDMWPPEQPGRSGPATTLVPQREMRFEPFALTDVQEAYWLGRSGSFDLGNVGCHVYLELDLSNVDRGAVERAWRLLIDHHDMLRAVVTADGQQRVLRDVPPYVIEHTELAGLDAGAAEQAGLALRERMSHRLFEPDVWPLFELRTSRRDRLVLHLSLDLLFVDFWSIQILLREMVALVRDPDPFVQPIDIGFRDYVLWRKQQEGREAFRQGEAYWRRRLATLPPAPQLPLARRPADVARPRFVRRSHVLEAAAWQAIKQRSAQRGFTPSIGLVAGFASVLARHSAEPRFTLNLTQFLREPVHPQIHRLIGDFTSVLLLEIEALPALAFEDLAGAVGRQLWRDLEHRDYGGLRVMRDLGRAGRHSAMPIVFTSALARQMPGLDGMEIAPIIHGVSQTPQVWLDHQVFEHAGRLHITWDSLDELFPDRLLDGMFEAYTALLASLAGDETAWTDVGSTPHAAGMNGSGTRTDGQLPLHSNTAQDVSGTSSTAAASSQLVAALARHPLIGAFALVEAGGSANGDATLYVEAKPADRVGAATTRAPWPTGPLLSQERRRRLLEIPGDVRELMSELAALETRATRTMVETLGALGVFSSSGETHSPRGIVQRCGVLPDYAGLIGRWLGYLAQDGLLHENGDGSFTCPRPLEPTSRHERAGATSPALAMSEFLEVCRDRLLSVLRGEQSPLELLFPSGTWHVAEALYEHNPLSRHVNAQAGAIIAELAGRTDGPIRVLEIGAGVGSATGALLAVLPPERTTYVFTDVTAFFNERAREKLAGHPFVEYGVLDALRDPLAQGHVPERFDLIVGANVMHNADVPAEALAGLRPLLAPGGLIMLIEATRDTRVHSVSIGLIEGLRRAGEWHGEPFLSLGGWLDAVTAAGFSDAVSLREPSDRTHDLGLDVVIARAGPLAPEERTRAFASAAQCLRPTGVRDHLMRELPAASLPREIVVVPVLPRTPAGEIDIAQLSARPATRGAARGVLSETEAALARLWSRALGRDSIAADDSFFELGGDSLIAVRVSADVRERFGVELRAQVLYDRPRLREVAAEIERLMRTAGEEPPARPFLPALIPDPAGASEPFPLTEIQQAYWIGRSGILEIGNVSTHLYLEIAAAAIEVGRLEDALDRLIKRHAMMRAIVESDGRQRVLPEVPRYRIEVEDVSHLPAEDAEQAVAAQRARMSHRLSSGGSWPLFEIRLTRVSPASARLHVSLDLLMVDMWSIRLLMREWLLLYLDPAMRLPRLDVSFRDYVLATQGLAETATWKQSLGYWRRRVPELPPPPELPLRCDPAAVKSPRFERRSARLEPAAWRQIRERARAAQLTPSAVLLTAFAEVIATWSRHPRFTINLTMFNRLPLHAHINRIVGDFTTTSLLAVDGGGSRSFVERARELQGQLWRDMEHRQVSGVRVLREIARTDLSQPYPIMPIVFTSGLLHDSAEPDLLESPADHGLGEIVHSVSQTPQVWIDHQVYEQAGQLHVSWDAVDELFPPDLVGDMFEAYCGLLRQLAEIPAAWNERYRCLVPAGQLAVRQHANDTAGPLPSGLLHERFLDQARSAPQRVAVVMPGGRMTYGEVAARAMRLARRLRALGAQPDRLIAIVMEKGWEQVVGAIAILEAGGAYLPIDPELPRDRRHLLLERGEARVVLTQARLRDRLEWPPGAELIAVDAEPLETEGADIAPLPRKQAGTDLAYVIFTSGSTGEPKGVMIEHAAALNTIIDINERFGLGPDDRILALSSLSFDLSVWDVFGALSAGAAIVIPGAGSAREPADWLDLVVRERVTIWNSVPALLEMLVEHVGHRRVVAGCALRLALLSGDWIPVKLPADARERLPGLEIVSLGGATEASIWSILHPIEALEPDWPSVPYGRPLRNQSFHVLDDALEPCPEWVPGQLHIGGAGLARGYWRDEARTAAQFIVHPRTGERLYRTGDLGRYRPGGIIEFQGREDGQVKVQGYRIEIGEIEAALRGDDRCRAAAVVVVGDRFASRHLVAFVVAEADIVASLRDRLRQRLPAYMVPSVWRTLDALPLTSNGKIDRRELVQRASHNVPAAAEPRPAEAPPSELTEKIRALISRELDVVDLAADQNLLSLGASSLDLVRIVGQFEAQFGVRPSIQEFFAAPTAAALAQVVSRQAPGAPAPAGTNGSTAPGPQRRSDLVLDPAARRAFHAQDIGIRRFPADWGLIPLPDIPSAAPRSPDLFDRRSVRTFRAAPVPLQDLGSWLGALRRRTLADTSKYAYGSAGGCYPVQAYVHAKPDGITGCGPGLYYYHPIEHGLVPLSLGVEIDASAHEPFTNRPVFERAKLSLFLVSEPRAIEPLYGDLSWRFCLLEAGAMTHLLETTAGHYGLGVCQIGTLELSAVRPLLHLDDGQELLHSLIGGLLDEATSSTMPAWEQGTI